MQQSIFYTAMSRVPVVDMHTTKILKLNGLCKVLRYGMFNVATGWGRQGFVTHHVDRRVFNITQTCQLETNHPENRPQVFTNKSGMNQIINFCVNNKTVAQFLQKAPEGMQSKLLDSLSQPLIFQNYDVVFTKSEINTAVIYPADKNPIKPKAQNVIINLNNDTNFHSLPSNFPVNHHHANLSLELVQSSIIQRDQMTVIGNVNGKQVWYILPLNAPLTKKILTYNGEILGKSVNAEISEFRNDPEQYNRSLVAKQDNYLHVVGPEYTLNIVQASKSNLFGEYIVIWTTFLSNIKNTPNALGISLGTQDHVSILDVPFSLQCTKIHNLGHAYIEVLDNNQLKIAPISQNDPLGISQAIVITDVLLSLSSVEGSIDPSMITTLHIGEETFTELTERAIELFKIKQCLYADIDTDCYPGPALEGYQFVFHSKDEEPGFGEPYIDRCMELQNQLHPYK